MKYILIIFGFLLLASCTKNDSFFKELPLEAQNIVGTWELNGQKISAGGPLPEDFTEIKGGLSFTFRSNGSYDFKDQLDGNLIHEGTFEVMGNELVLHPSLGEVEQYRYAVQLTYNTMVLSPTAPSICIEGCLYRYRRAN